MKVRALYFASARDLAATPAETLSLPEGASVEDLVQAALKLHPKLKAVMGSSKLSVNVEVVPAGTRLRDGDKVGFLPPVAGG
ncbi:MAG: MoaD/ThiS family protein [Nitrososphaerota archaeon]|nr:MoaD/ThiS family protein [Nitrososphaerota archaeon]